MSGQVPLGHDRSRPHHNEDEEEEDPVEKMLKKQGCLDQHYAVQDCMGEYKDWRKCQNEVQIFKDCIEKAKKKKL